VQSTSFSPLKRLQFNIEVPLIVQEVNIREIMLRVIE
jgi:hypothetical protein